MATILMLYPNVKLWCLRDALSEFLVTFNLIQEILCCLGLFDGANDAYISMVCQVQYARHTRVETAINNEIEKKGYGSQEFRQDKSTSL